MVFGVIFIFTNKDALINLIKLIICNYYNNKDKVPVSPLQKINHGWCIQGEDKRGSKYPTSHRFSPLPTTYILFGLVPHLKQAKNVHNNKY